MVFLAATFAGLEPFYSAVILNRVWNDAVLPWHLNWGLLPATGLFCLLMWTTWKGRFLEQERARREANAANTDPEPDGDID